MDGDDRRGRARSFLLGGLLGASAAIATARRRREIGAELASRRVGWIALALLLASLAGYGLAFASVAVVATRGQVLATEPLPDRLYERPHYARGGYDYWHQLADARLVLGVSVRDLTGGFKCFRRKVLEAIDLSQVRSNGYAFQIEMSFRAWRKHFKIVEIPIVFVDRTEGQSKMSRSIVREAIWMVWRLRFWALRGIV